MLRVTSGFRNWREATYSPIKKYFPLIPLTISLATCRTSTADKKVLFITLSLSDSTILEILVNMTTRGESGRQGVVNKFLASKCQRRHHFLCSKEIKGKWHTLIVLSLSLSRRCHTSGWISLLLSTAERWRPNWQHCGHRLNRPWGIQYTVLNCHWEQFAKSPKLPGHIQSCLPQS